MTLPFDIPDKNKRKWTCFVCGRMFPKWSEFKDHILEEHEEGREYVRCPLSHCGAPVRDIPSHFKAKHPHTKCPKVPQKKALIWKDWGGRKKKKKPQFHQGHYESTKMGCKFLFRSGWEEEVYKCLDSLLVIEAFEAEPFKIPYTFDGKLKSYTPDLIVNFSDGHTEIWEIKPANQTMLEQNNAKWHAAANYCKPRGWDFVVQTEKGINMLKQQLKTQHQMLFEEDE